ncbi:MAG: 50S ribosomal protein L21 [Saprospiraceae bacterium]|nr:50S ribosomal protein L21 [Saprospiraceae bacterium]
MYAIVEIAGKQMKVEKGQKVFVHRLDSEEGNKVDFDNVLLIEDEGKVKVGTPAIDGAKVTAKVIEHCKGDKVIVFKKKRRKGYTVRNGHRQYLTKIEIENITASGSKAPKAEPKAEVKKETPKVEAKKAEPKVEAKKEAPITKKEEAPKAEAEPKAE